MTACPIRYQRQVPDRKGKIFYTSITSLSHISKFLWITSGCALGTYFVKVKIMFISTNRKQFVTEFLSDQISKPVYVTCIFIQIIVHIIIAFQYRDKTVCLNDLYGLPCQIGWHLTF